MVSSEYDLPLLYENLLHNHFNLIFNVVCENVTKQKEPSAVQRAVL